MGTERKCYCCVEKHNSQDCRYECSELGLVAQVCRKAKNSNEAKIITESNETGDNTDDDMELFSVFRATDSTQGIVLEVKLKNTPAEMQVGTGTTVTIISESM